MEKFLVEYIVNSIWQVPLLAVGAWLTLRVLRPNPAVQHRIWLGVLPLMLAMPLVTHRATTPPIAPAPAVTAASSIEEIPADTAAPSTDINMQSAEHTDPQTPLFSGSIPAPDLPAQPRSANLPHVSLRPLREMTLTQSATRALVGLYLAAIAFMAIRLLLSARASRRLIAQARPVMLSQAASEQLDRCCERFAVARPRVLVSQHASSPMVVGAFRPSLLLPHAFAARLEHPATQSRREIEAVWLHELAHLQRRDHLTNLICRIAALPIAYHPAAHAVQQRIRQTREMLCDEMAAAAMQSPLSYARCLVGLARTMHGITPQIEAVGMFDNGILEERIMQLTKTRTTLSARTRTIRFAAGAAMMLAVLAAPAVLHVTPTLAQAPAPTPSDAAAPSALAALQSTDQPQTAATAESAESKKKAAETKAAAAQTKAVTAESESNAQLQDARHRLDDAATAYGNLAAKSADAKGKSTDAETPEFKQRLDDARKQLSEATHAFNDQIAKTVDSTIREKELRTNSAELNQRMAEVQARLNSPEFKARIAEAQATLNSPEFKAQIERLNSPEFKKQIADAQAKFNSPEFKEKTQKLAEQAAKMQAKFNSPEFKAQIARLDSPEFKKQMAEMQSKFNTPEWKEKTQKLAEQTAKMQAKFNSPEFKAQMEKLNSPEFKKQIEECSETAKKMSILDDEVSRQMDKVSRQIDEALRLFRENAPKQ
jgi:beta-lactamase regulating signal transducer with metallopeptidase domain